MRAFDFATPAGAPPARARDILELGHEYGLKSGAAPVLRALGERIVLDSAPPAQACKHGLPANDLYR